MKAPLWVVAASITAASLTACGNQSAAPHSSQIRALEAWGAKFEGPDARSLHADMSGVIEQVQLRQRAGVLGACRTGVMDTTRFLGQPSAPARKLETPWKHLLEASQRYFSDCAHLVLASTAAARDAIGPQMSSAYQAAKAYQAEMQAAGRAFGLIPSR